MLRGCLDPMADLRYNGELGMLLCGRGGCPGIMASECCPHNLNLKVEDDRIDCFFCFFCRFEGVPPNLEVLVYIINIKPIVVTTKLLAKLQRRKLNVWSLTELPASFIFYSLYGQTFLRVVSSFFYVNESRHCWTLCHILKKQTIIRPFYSHPSLCLVWPYFQTVWQSVCVCEGGHGLITLR